MSGRIITKIPKEDLEAINGAFRQTGKVETLRKDRLGRIVGARRSIVNDRSIIFQDFSGRILARRMSYIAPGTKQQIIGEKGQMYDDIPKNKRDLIVWKESDFE